MVGVSMLYCAFALLKSPAGVSDGMRGQGGGALDP